MDLRLTLIRDGVAAAALEGRVAARAYRPVTPMRLAAPRAPMRHAPDAAAEATSELLFGEAFDVLLQEAGFAFGQSRRDGYVGFVPAGDLTGDAGPPTHRVSAQAAPAFSRADIKAPEPLLLPRNALVRVTRHEGRFAHVDGAVFVVEAQLAPIGVYERDAAGAALGYLGAPYLWGGRSSAGLDCSGLVQMALTACGRACPRDSDMQRDVFAAAPQAALQRGDLVFWPGHVAMLTDGETLVHANAHHMQVAVEPVAETIARIGEPTAYRRP